MLTLVLLGTLLALPAQDSLPPSAEEFAVHCFHGETDSIAACDEAFVRLKTPREQANALLAKGMLQTNAEDYGPAAATMRQALALVPQDPQAHVLYGWALEKAGNHDGADAQYSQAMTQGLVADNQIQWKEVVDQLIQNIGGDGDFYYTVARGFERIGKHYVAKTFYLDAAGAFEKNPSPIVLDVYNHAVRMDPDDADIHYRIAIFLSHWDPEQSAEVIHQLEQAVLLDRNDPDYRYELAHQYLASGDSAKAVEQLQLALDLKPGLRQAKDDLEISVAGSTVAAPSVDYVDSPEALKQLDACIDQDGLRGEMACRRALKIGLSARNAAEAHTFLAPELSGDAVFAEYQAAIQADPTYPMAYLMFGEALASRPVTSAGTQNHQDAESLLATASKLHPEWVAPYRHLALYLWSRKKYDDALRAQHNAVSLDPEDTSLSAQLRQWENDLESYHNELKEAASAVQGRPNDANAQQRFADALFVMGREDEARNAYRAAYKLNPHLGWSMASHILYRGFPDVACEILPHVRVADDPSRSVASLESDLDSCARMYPKTTESLTSLAKLQMRDGNIDGALHTFQEAVRRDTEYFESHPEERTLYDRAKTLKRPDR